MASRRYECVAIGGVQLRKSLTYSGRAGRPSRHRARLVRHRDRLAEMGDRLLEGRAAERLVARLAPPFDGEIVEAGLGEMMGDRGVLGIGIVALLCLIVLASVFMLSNEMPQIVAVLTLQCFLGLILGICLQWTAPFLWRNKGQLLELFDKIRGL
jgi:hypothetical protein